MAETTEDVIRGIMADILDLEPMTIDDDTMMENVESWDSSNHINLVLALEQHFGICFDVREIESMVSFRDVVQTVEGKL